MKYTDYELITAFNNEEGKPKEKKLGVEMIARDSVKYWTELQRSLRILKDQTVKKSHKFNNINAASKLAKLIISSSPYLLFPRDC